MQAAQGKLGEVDAETIEARLTEITDKFNRAKQHIADQKAKLDAEQREADDLKAKADDAVPTRHRLCLRATSLAFLLTATHLFIDMARACALPCHTMALTSCVT